MYKRYPKVRKTTQERNTNLESLLHPDLMANDRVKIQKFESRKFKRGLQEDEVAIPVSPKLAPYTVEDPIFGAKNYWWCSCGMSKKQPFCDSSHKGTSFDPIKFTLESPSDNMNMCGCKLSSSAPFCDGKTCLNMLQGKQIENIEELTEPADIDYPNVLTKKVIDL